MKRQSPAFSRRARCSAGLLLLLAALATTARAEAPQGNGALETPAVAVASASETVVAEPGLLERLGARLLQYLPWRIAATRIGKPAEIAVENKAASEKAAPAQETESARPVEAAANKDHPQGAPPPDAEPGFIARTMARLTPFLPWSPHPASSAGKPAAEEQAASAPPEKHDPAGPPAPVIADAAKAPEVTRPEVNSPDAKSIEAAPPAAAQPEPVRLIRQLQNLQERVATGDRAAFVEQPHLMNSLTQAFNAAPPEVWGKVENARALIIYLLSGGSSTLGRKILATHRVAPSEEPLAKGALAYLDDRPGADQDDLLALDPRALDLNLGGHVAFVQSILLTFADRARAIAKLDEARLLMPGSLVEEAALRREVALLAETENFDKFAALARQYWTRFRASPYADNFLRQFTLAAARVSLSIRADQWNRLDELLENLQPETRRAIYLNMAHAALVSGNVALGAAAAQRGLPLFAEGSLDRQRAQLYIAAAQVATPDFARADAALGRIERGKLAAGDALLAQATALVAGQMRSPPQQGFTAEPPGEPSSIDATMARAQTGLKVADEAMDSLRKTMEGKTP